MSSASDKKSRETRHEEGPSPHGEDLAQDPMTENPAEDSEHEISQTSTGMDLGEPDAGNASEENESKKVRLRYPMLPPEGLSTRRFVVKCIEDDKRTYRDYVMMIEERYSIEFEEKDREKVEASAKKMISRYRKVKQECSRTKEIAPSTSTSTSSKAKKPSPALQTINPERKDFEDVGYRQKKRRLDAIVETVKATKVPPEEALVTLVKASSPPQRNELANIIKHCLMTPGRPKKVLDSLNSTSITTKSPEAAYGLMLDTGVSVRNYSKFKYAAEEEGAFVFPSYKSILAIKSTLRPPEAAITTTYVRAKVELQALLDLTCERILKMQRDVLRDILFVSNGDISFIISWGFDGSTGQSNYKQTYTNTSSSVGPKTDSALFATTIIPLQVIQKSTRYILWQNPISQSVRFCRPIELEFVKETKEVVKDKHQSMLKEIAELKPYEATEGDKKVNINYDLVLTIIDGKILNIITNTASVNCPICRAFPSMFNDLTNFSNGKFTPQASSLKHGINPMHAYIRMLDLFLHIGYKVNVKRWKVYDPAQKIEVEQRKLFIQGELFQRMGLRVDFPNPGGAGSSNDGNTARRAFKDYETFAEILGLDKELLRRIRIVLQTISHNFPIDPDLFGKYCRTTAEHFIAKYKWYYMNPTLHKILIHGEEIVRNSVLPLGMLSEQAAESKNKYYRQDRLHHARKTSRTANMTDMFYRSIDFSDPLISTQSLSRAQLSVNRIPLEKEAIELLIEPEHPTSSEKIIRRALLQENEIQEHEESGDSADDDDIDDVFMHQLPNNESI